jgi:hypothetical protein
MSVDQHSAPKRQRRARSLLEPFSKPPAAARSIFTPISLGPLPSRKTQSIPVRPSQRPRMPFFFFSSLSLHQLALLHANRGAVGYNAGIIPSRMSTLECPFVAPALRLATSFRAEYTTSFCRIMTAHAWEPDAPTLRFASVHLI